MLVMLVVLEKLMLVLGFFIVDSWEAYVGVSHYRKLGS